MEQNNSPEKKKSGPLTDDCSKCGEIYTLTPENTVLNHYSTDDNMDNLICRCPHCQWRTRIFIRENTFEQAVNEGIPLIAEKYAGEAVVNDFQELMGMVPVETYELTNRHEAIIRRFGEVVLSTPDEHLFDLIADTGYGKPHPLKWID